MLSLILKPKFLNRAPIAIKPVSYTHLRAHETPEHLVCRLLLEKKTIILVEQNAKKGLEFADIGYVLVSGQTAIAGKGDDLLKNPDVGRLFLGG